MRWDPVLRLVGKNRNPRPELMESLRDAPLAGDHYADFVLQWDYQFYRDRVQMVDFVAADRVLDAGCGLGQFAAALAAFNRDVVAVDQADWRLETARILCERWGCPQVTVEHGMLPDLDYPDESFDLIWCAGVLMFVNRPATMATFHRLLRPGGRLYVTINSRGRWLYKLLAAFFKNDRRNLRKAWRAWRHGHEPDERLGYLNRRDVPAFCRRHGFEMLGVAPDGCLDLSGRRPPRRRPMFARRFLLFFENNIEFVARKK